MNTAKKIKIISALMIFGAIPGCGVGEILGNDNVAIGIFCILFFVGLIGFIAGRFME